jgi:hypothetical protein
VSSTILSSVLVLVVMVGPGPGIWNRAKQKRGKKRILFTGTDVLGPGKS